MSFFENNSHLRLTRQMRMIIINSIRRNGQIMDSGSMPVFLSPCTLGCLISTVAYSPGLFPGIF